MLVSKLRIWTSKTKAGPVGLVRVALFWKSYCATCSPACVILYHVTGSCKGHIICSCVDSVFKFVSNLFHLLYSFNNFFLSTILFFSHQLVFELFRFCRRDKFFFSEFSFYPVDETLGLTSGDRSQRYFADKEMETVASSLTPVSAEQLFPAGKILQIDERTCYR